MLVELTDDGERRICAAIGGRLKQARDDLQKLIVSGQAGDERLGKESTVVEPPFIVGVRELVAMVIDRSLTVRTR
jgi:hypothetical protein